MRKILIAGALVALTLTGACAPGARNAMMAVPTGELAAFDPASPLRGSIQGGQVQGGEETNPMLASQIANNEFNLALQASLRNAGLLAPQDGGSYRLIANIQNVRQPMVGLDMTVTMTVQYTLVPTAGGAAIFDEVVTVSGTATVGEAFAGVERLRIANERAARENIKEFVRRLQVRFPGATIAGVS